MSAPINTQHRKWNYLIAFAPVATCVSLVFLRSTGRRPSADAGNKRFSACFRSVCLGSAVETGGATMEKCQFRCRV